MTHGYENQPFLDVIICMQDNGCMANYPTDGICFGNDEDGVKEVTKLEQIAGDWWVVQGLSCGQGDFPGGYDWYPCQHHRFIQQKSGQWINNITYCGGKEDKCVSGMIVTIANISLPSPGVVRHDYTDTPLAPHVL